MSESLIEHLSRCLEMESNSRRATAREREMWLCQLSIVDALRSGGSLSEVELTSLTKKAADLEFLLGMG